MSDLIERKRVLIVVKTYPHPSLRYQELVCTAGITEEGSFIRLYPLNYRYLPLYLRFQKYQWIEVQVTKRTKDFRPETYTPALETLEILGEPIPTANNWQDRKKVVLAQPLNSMCGLRRAYDENHTSLGIIRPNKIDKFTIVPDDAEWEPKHQEALSQYCLFDKKKELIKIPYTFSYHFTCEEEGCKGHKMMISDWELGALYLKEFRRLGSPLQAANSIRVKFYDDLCASDKDIHFFVGTTYPKNAWIILGAFYPKKSVFTPKLQQTLELL